MKRRIPDVSSYIAMLGYKLTTNLITVQIFTVISRLTCSKVKISKHGVAYSLAMLAGRWWRYNFPATFLDEKGVCSISSILFWREVTFFLGWRKIQTPNAWRRRHDLCCSKGHLMVTWRCIEVALGWMSSLKRYKRLHREILRERGGRKSKRWGKKRTGEIADFG